MTGLGITGETVITKIVQTNPALEMYDKIDPNVSNSTGSWVKDKTYQDVTVSNVGDFSFLLLDEETTAKIVISYGTDKTLTIDVKSKLTIEVVPPIITATVPETVPVGEAVTQDTSTGQITAFTPGETLSAEVTLTKGAKDYENVRVVVTGLDDEIQLIAQDSDGNWFNIVKSGWGPPKGFELKNATPKVTKVYIIASEAGTYTATVQLVNVSANNVVLASAEFSITATVAEEATTEE